MEAFHAGWLREYQTVVFYEAFEKREFLMRIACLILQLFNFRQRVCLWSHWWNRWQQGRTWNLYRILLWRILLYSGLIEIWARSKLRVDKKRIVAQRCLVLLWFDKRIFIGRRPDFLRWILILGEFWRVKGVMFRRADIIHISTDGLFQQLT